MTTTKLSTRGSESPEVAAHQTASREHLPIEAGDDFGLLCALAWVIPAGFVFWATVVCWWLR